MLHWVNPLANGENNGSDMRLDLIVGHVSDRAD